jgi:osmotically inducible protein OsmC
VEKKIYVCTDPGFLHPGKFFTLARNRKSGLQITHFMAIRRNATSVWEGSGKEGMGHLTTQSTVLDQTQYSYKTRFEDGVGTNPEELIAAAHAGCFNMKLSFVLGVAGFTPTKLETKCTISLDSGAVTESHLALTATVPGIDQDKFAECVADAKQNCPISKLLNCEIRVDASLK